MLIHITQLLCISYFSTEGIPLSKNDVKYAHHAYLELNVEDLTDKINLARTFISNNKETCIFSLKTNNGYGVYDVCTENGHFIDKESVVEIENGKVDVLKRKRSSKKVMKIFLINENKRVRKYGAELLHLTQQVFMVAKSFIEKEDYGSFGIELALHGIMDIDNENMYEWNINEVINKNKIREEKRHHGKIINRESILRNIDDIKTEDEYSSLYMKKELKILDNETEEKLRNIGLTDKKRGPTSAYKLISKYLSQYSDINELESDNLPTDFQAPENLEKFADFLEPIKNDMKNKGSLFSTSNLVILLTEKEDNSNIEGLTFIGGACSTNDSYSIIRFKSTDSLFYHGKVMAHEIIHSLNATHDSDGGRLMEKQGCTTCMEDDRKMSEKTKKQIVEFILDQEDVCFERYNLCGNGIVDEGEECDPGTPFGSQCCTSTCKLKPNSECDDLNGKCCKDCKLQEKDTKCMDARNECENDVVCSGDSPICFKSYKEDGTPCTDGICKKGVCQNRELMCERIGRRFDRGCNAANTCELVCVDSKNRCNLMGAIMKGLQSPLSLPDGIPCKINGIRGSCLNGKCEVNSLFERSLLVIGSILMVLIVVLIIILGFLA